MLFSQIFKRSIIKNIRLKKLNLEKDPSKVQTSKIARTQNSYGSKIKCQYKHIASSLKRKHSSSSSSSSSTFKHNRVTEKVNQTKQNPKKALFCFCQKLIEPNMKRVRGFKMGHRFVRIFKWKILPRRIQSKKRLSPTRITNPVVGIRSLARCLSRGAKRLCGGKKVSGKGQSQIRLGKDPKMSQIVPRGHLVVHVGKSDGDTQRVVVPVIYFNHPLFGELLEQAERVHGFDQPGRITIPCRVSDFEKVQMRIAAWDHCRRKRTFKII